MHKKRGYNRDTPLVPVRDYRLFAIACEGEKTEPQYFELFSYMSRKIKVDIIDYEIAETTDNTIKNYKSAPKWVLDKAVKYIETSGFIDEDTLWFVLDVDRWDKEQLRNIAQLCEDKPNWHVVLSNPCFEVWLYFHKKANIEVSGSHSCRDFKHEISTFEKGGYHPLKFISDLEKAITNAEATDNHKDHYYPEFKETKVYLLGKALLAKIGRKSLYEFISSRLPELTIQKTKKSKKP